MRSRFITSAGVDEGTPLPYAKHVQVPTLMAQLRRDFLIQGERDGQLDTLSMHDRVRLLTFVL